MVALAIAACVLIFAALGGLGVSIFSAYFLTGQGNGNPSNAKSLDDSVWYQIYYTAIPMYVSVLVVAVLLSLRPSRMVIYGAYGLLAYSLVPFFMNAFSGLKGTRDALSAAPILSALLYAGFAALGITALVVR